MPIVANITPADPSTAPTSVTNMIDGDVVNANALVVQASPPAPNGNPNLTLSFIWSYLVALCTNIGAALVSAYTGTQYTIAAGSLQTFLRLLANTAARVDGSNTFNASQVFASQVTTQELLLMNGGAQVPAGQTIDAKGQVMLDSFTVSCTASGTSPVTLTTVGAVPHNVLDGQTVVAGSFGGNADGTWVAHVTSPTALQLVGSTGTGTYSTGTLSVIAQVMYSNPARTVTRVLTRWTMSSQVDVGGGNSAVWDFAADNSINSAGIFFANNTAPTTMQKQGVLWEIGADEAPHGAYIVSASVFYDPPSGHGSLPGHMPVATLCALAIGSTASAPTTTTIASQPDLAGSTGAYEVYKKLTATPGSPVQIDRAANRYFVVFEAESGAASLSNTTVYGASIVVKAPAPVQF